MARFTQPDAGAPIALNFPTIERATLVNGLRLWAIPQSTVPIASVVLVIPRGTRQDPSSKPGLASLTADLVDEGAGARDAIGLADAFSRLGASVDVEAGADATSISVGVVSRSIGPALDLVADMALRPRFELTDFERVRELRLSRLRQLSRSPGTLADRALVEAIFAGHGYGHGTMGTTRFLTDVTLDDAREFWQRAYGPAGATLIVTGQFDVGSVFGLARQAFESWTSDAAGDAAIVSTSLPPDRRVLFVDRPGAPQSELRIGHLGPPRKTEAYHALLMLNAILGGQFTSRLNRKLRESKGLTYGVRTSFDFRQVAGAFSCETNVQGDRTAEAVGDVLQEFADIRRVGAVGADELQRARAALTRGYVRNFETPGQIARAALQLVTFDLDDKTFDRFVPAIEGTTAGEVEAAAVEFIRPAEATVVVVGDAAACRASLDDLGRDVVLTTPEM
jgi:zinc protease